MTSVISRTKTTLGSINPLGLPDKPQRHANHPYPSHEPTIPVSLGVGIFLPSPDADPGFESRWYIPVRVPHQAHLNENPVLIWVPNRNRPNSQPRPGRPPSLPAKPKHPPNTVPYSRNSELIFNISEPKETVFLSHVKCTFHTPQAEPEKTTVGAQQPNSNVTSNYPHSQGYPMLLHTQYITLNRSYFLHRTNLILTHTSIIQH